MHGRGPASAMTAALGHPALTDFSKTFDPSTELKPHGVTVVSLYPGRPLTLADV